MGVYVGKVAISRHAMREGPLPFTEMAPLFRSVERSKMAIFSRIFFIVSGGVVKCADTMLVEITILILVSSRNPERVHWIVYLLHC